MSKKITIWAWMAMGVFLISGCATTGRNYQGDIDSLNARISSLQGQLSEKDAEISRLQGQMSQQQAALAQAEADKRLLEERLSSAQSQMEAQSRQAQTQAATDSDLK